MDCHSMRMIFSYQKKRLLSQFLPLWESSDHYRGGLEAATYLNTTAFLHIFLTPKGNVSQDFVLFNSAWCFASYSPLSDPSKGQQSQKSKI